MILSEKYTTDGAMIVLNVAGAKKEDVTVKGNKDGWLNVTIPQTDFYKAQSYSGKLPNKLDVVKTLAKMENGILTLKIPFKEDAQDVPIKVE